MFLYDTPPCKDCKKRCLSCHTACADYKNWKVEHDNKRTEISAKQKTENEILAARIEFSENYRRKTKGKRK